MSSENKQGKISLSVYLLTPLPKSNADPIICPPDIIVARTPSISSANEAVPPSFAESEFHAIQRRQVKRLGSNLLKWSSTPSRYPTLSNEWEFAGQVQYLENVCFQ
jgi:hypothetical protein